MSETELHTLLPLCDFKALYGIDDREDKLARFVLTTATYTIEQHCKRRLLVKNCSDNFEFFGEHSFLLREYPVREIIEVKIDGEVLESGFYSTLPDCFAATEESEVWNGAYYLALVPNGKLRRGAGISVKYRAGYEVGEVPGDLAAACLELAAWNLGRYRNRRVGVTVRGKNEGMESSLPENVRVLIEPHRRITI